jgi:hypothetical protein
MSWDDFLPKEVMDFIRGMKARPPRPTVPISAVSSTDIGNWLSPSSKSREQKDTAKLYAQVKEALTTSPFADEDTARQFITDMIVDICDERGVTPTAPLANALWDVIVGCLAADNMVLELKTEAPSPHLSLEEGVAIRKALSQQLAFLRDHERLLPIWRRKMVILLSGVLSHFPESAFTDIGEDGQALDDSIVLPSAKALHLCENVPLVVQRTALTFFDDDVVSAHHFDAIREQLDANAHGASGHGPDERHKEITFPTEHSDQDAAFQVGAYLGGTPFEDFFQSELPFAIPFPARFEHTHIIGGTGHGKTQLLQFLIHHDLVRAKTDNRSVIVIDSQVDLVKTVSGLKVFSREVPNSLADRFVLIDPTDIEYPVALNMFDFNRSRLSGFAPLDREKILNATIELYEYFFGALLGAELTQRQGLIFRYLARLLIEIPGATIHTLRELMEDGEKFLPYMEKLEGTTRAFFATRFFDPSFRETKKQILTRLWGVLGNSALERMFSHKESKIDLFDLMNSGKIIFINTAKDLLGQDGSAIFGRFFIALIAQAAVQRSAIPSHERSPCFVYIDEAAEYFDQSIAMLLTQARKYKVGMIFAHQTLDQLGSDLKGSVLSSTTIKFAGGVSSPDARTLAPEYRCDSDFLLAQKREAKQTHFACYVKNYTNTALSIAIPLGFVESLPTLNADEQEFLTENNRDLYTAPPETQERVEFRIREEPRPKATRPAPQPRTETPEVFSATPTAAQALRRSPPRPAVPTDPGKGGQEHKYLQHLIKRLAEERNVRATIEENILSGKGQVDVSLVLGKRKIACEISVTTNKDHELQNVEKCIAAGYSEIWLIGATDKHSKSLAKFIEEHLDDGHGASIRYLSPETIADAVDEVAGPAPTTTAKVKGYTVTTKSERLSPEESAKRRSAIAEVVARGIDSTKT